MRISDWSSDVCASDLMDDNPLVAVFRGDQLERSDDDALGWDLRAGIGRNFDKLWLRSEGERRDGRLAHASTELFWSHATGPWWDRTIGLRHDSNPAGRDRDWAAIGVQGLAPYKFEVEATGYIGTSGRLAARLEGEYEVLLTNRLILQPKLEANLYSRDDDENHIGKGLSDASFGLRLRYEFSRRFAPYVGHVWTRRFGDTADFVEAAGGDAGEHAWVAGVRFWFCGCLPVVSGLLFPKPFTFDQHQRSHERRVGKECARTGRFWWARDHKKNNNIDITSKY